MRSNFVSRRQYRSDQVGVLFRDAAENEKRPPRIALVEQPEQFHRVPFDVGRELLAVPAVNDPRKYFCMIILLDIDREIEGLNAHWSHR